MRPSPPRLLAAALVLAAALAACDSGPPPVDRTAEIAEARQALGPPASLLGTAAATLGARAEQVAADPDEMAITSLREAAGDLDDAVTGTQDLGLDPEVPDVEDAVDALDAAAAAASSLVDDAQVLADAATVIVDASAEVESVRGEWDAAGSFSEQLARFDELVVAAAALVDSLVDLEAPGCAGAVGELQSAAEAVVGGTDELRDLVVARDGAAFDERRLELAEDPYGLGVTALPMPLDVASCPVVDHVADGTAAVVSSLDDLEGALNPADLAGEAG